MFKLLIIPLFETQTTEYLFEYTECGNTTCAVIWSLSEIIRHMLNRKTVLVIWSLKIICDATLS